MWSLLKKLKNRIYDPAVPLGIYPKESKSAFKRHQHTYVYCSTIYNNQAMKPAEGPVNRWMDKENVIYIHNGVLFSHREEWSFVIFKETGWN
jgi:hypothetical protein